MNRLMNMLTKPWAGKSQPMASANEMRELLTRVLDGGSGETWIPLAREQTSFPIRKQTASSASSSAVTGEIMLDSKAIQWVQFDWSCDQYLDHCTVYRSVWRFYETGLICLEMNMSKDSASKDIRDLFGHRIELRDQTDFLIEIWAAFLISRGSQRPVFQATATDDHLPLKLHFDQFGAIQDGFAFRI